MKKTRLHYVLFLATIFISKKDVNAQMVGTDAYIKGDFVEVAFNGSGGFEGVDVTVSPPPAGMHFRSGGPNIFGFVANPQKNSWATFDGDFFTPGSPENGWGFEIGSTGGLSGSNNASGPIDIIGSITSYSLIGSNYLIDWDGTHTASGLHFHINYKMSQTDLFYKTTITITNTTATTINNIYYYRNMDPDNNQSLSGDYTTQNTIVSQHVVGTGTRALVSATSLLPSTQPQSFFSFYALDTSGWKAGYGGFSNRDASDMYDGTGLGFEQGIDSTRFADEAIFLAHLTSSLSPGASESFQFTNFSDSTSSTVGIVEAQNNLIVTVYPNPFDNEVTFNLGASFQPNNLELQVYDFVGRGVATMKNIKSSVFKFQRNNLVSGIYFYKLINANSDLTQGSFIIK